MRRFEVRYREEAIEDLEGIFFTVLTVSGSFSIATGFVERIRARCERIGDAPYGGVARDALDPNLRLTPFERTAVIVYKVEADCVRISNIFYGGRDYEAFFRNDDTD